MSPRLLVRNRPLPPWLLPISGLSQVSGTILRALYAYLPHRSHADISDPSSIRSSKRGIYDRHGEVHVAIGSCHCSLHSLYFTLSLIVLYFPGRERTILPFPHPGRPETARRWPACQPLRHVFVL
ncbi:hypothetical protein JB92DRAFT_2945167 [Gautieria morchelliformis]|nr:hypothetical protein JB92DRAFT_2945167 [Gautieria morchelliformis]